jgi:cytochrome b6-f complex iron-sulfur subunit
MASITANESKSAIAAQAPAAAAPRVEVAAPSRREFLYYIWGASMVLLLGQASALFIWFALPRFREGTFGGVFTITADRVPFQGNAPYNEAGGRFWVAHPEGGVVVLYGVCTHLGCLPKWSQANNRFECPCHGSIYSLDGALLDGPAPRALDRFASTIVFTDGTTAEMNAAGDPIPLNGKEIASIAVNTGRRIQRPGRT